MRQDFPITAYRAYLNAASVGPLSNRVVGAVHWMLGDAQMNGCNNSSQRFAFAENQIRPGFASLIGASASEIAFVKNTTEGINIVANGIPWEKGDNVVIADIEYPANVYAWLNLARHGVDVRWIKSKEASGRVTFESLTGAVDSRTKLISLSAVQFSSGFRHDLDRTGDFCRKKGILLHYDAIQIVGSLAIDAGRSHFDFLSAGGHKWMAGPFGTGFFYCRSASLDRLVPHAIGPGSMANTPWDIEYNISNMHSDARRFEEALPNHTGLWGLHAAVTTIRQIGINKIEKHVLRLNKLAIDELQRKRYHIASSLVETERSGILCFRHSTIPSEQLSVRLAQAGVDVTVRQGNMRISPHFYNNSDDICALVEALPD